MITRLELFRSMINEEKNKVSLARGKGAYYVILSLFRNSLYNGIHPSHQSLRYKKSLLYLNQKLSPFLPPQLPASKLLSQHVEEAWR